MKEEDAITKVWDYMQLHEKSHSAEALIILGCRDARVVEHGAVLADRYRYS